jgi:hypothetical protein
MEYRKRKNILRKFDLTAAVFDATVRAIRVREMHKVPQLIRSGHANRDTSSSG